MENNLKVSVIMAAYNAEVYLEEALDSAILQTMDNEEYEIIVVDDGSKDGTAAILDRYAEEYSHVKVIHKENGGPSDARNVGLGHATGKYVYFFDADDIVLPDSLTLMYEKMEEEGADLLVGKYNFFDNIRLRPITNLDDVIEKGIIDRYDMDLLWTFSLWNKLYKREIIEENQLRFPPVSYSEDGVFYLQYLYKCKKIVGLDRFILNYRKTASENPNAITSTITPKKIADYITSHRMMVQCIKDSFMKDHPEYTDIKDLMADNQQVRDYIGAFYRKEVQILLDQFFIKFWIIPYETRKLIKDEVEHCFKQTSMKELFQLSEFFFDYSLYDIPLTAEDALKQAVFTICLYGDKENEEQFLRSLTSLEEQTLILIRLLVPEHMRATLEEKNMIHENVFFVPCQSEAELFEYTRKNATTEYVMFADPRIIYFYRGIRYQYGKLKSSLNDFVSGIVYHQDYGDIQPIVASKIASDSLKECVRYNDDLWFDALLGNKYFKTSFIRNLDFSFEDDILEIQKKIYSAGYYNHRYSRDLIFDGTEKEYIDYIVKAETKEHFEEKFVEKPVNLKEKQYQYDLVRSGERYVKYDGSAKDYKRLSYLHYALSKLPLKNRVAFLSIRKDGSLDTNADALYQKVKSKKVFYSKKLPHSFSDVLKFVYYMLTSKVIVTDDYVKYLRYFPLRRNQRVIQLWHACGAFKKFGIRGGNINGEVDRATHAQYNLVSVSGEDIRQIYADAFDISFEKVRALGVPRTDFFYDEAYINDKKEKVYAKYPEFKEKQVIIYAPTFRDVNMDRTVFEPEIDFDLLSRQLLPHQMFLICPHPLMKNAIVEKKYDNIKVIRDFSTNDMMFVSDAMITDYSSVIFEYALLRKPMAFYCYDLKIYDRGFYMKYPEDLPGNVYENQEELCDFLRNIDQADKNEKLDLFIQKYMAACDGHSSERIAKIIDDYMKQK